MTRPHASKNMRQKIKKLDCEVQLGSPYIPDLALSDYQLFSPSNS